MKFRVRMTSKTNHGMVFVPRHHSGSITILGIPTDGMTPGAEYDVAITPRPVTVAPVPRPQFVEQDHAA